MVLVTGGAGYIGSNIVETLVENGYKVVVVDTKRPVKGNSNVVYINYDICGEELKYVFKNYDIDTVIHCAALKDITESIQNPLDYYKNNVYGTVNVLMKMLEYGTKNIIFSSTACIYEDGIAKETDKVRGNNPYAKSKIFCEEAIKESGLNYVIFRYFNVAGNDIDGNMLIQRIKRGEDITILGGDYDTKDGTCVRDYVHVEDIASAHLNGIEYLNKGGTGTFNLGNGKGYTIKEICEEAGVNYEIKGRRESDVIVSVADNTQAVKVLGWKPKKKLNDILRGK